MVSGPPAYYIMYLQGSRPVFSLPRLEKLLHGAVAVFL